MVSPDAAIQPSRLFSAGVPGATPRVQPFMCGPHRPAAPLPSDPEYQEAVAMTTIGLIGAGHIGSQVARLAIAHGYNVVISNSRGPETLSELVAELGPGARAATAVEAATAGDIVVVTVPLKNYRSVPVEPLKGKSSSTRTTTTRNATATSVSSTMNRPRPRSSCRHTSRRRRSSKPSTTSTPRSSRPTASRPARRTGVRW